MGIIGDPFSCPSWEPEHAEDEGRMERRLSEARESVRIREAVWECEERRQEAPEE
jgi:hypothetical protein